MAAAPKMTVTTTGDVSDVLNATGTEVQTASDSADTFISSAFPILHGAIESDTGIDPDLDTSTHYAGTVVSSGAHFDITGTNLGKETGNSTLKTITYETADYDASLHTGSMFTITGTMVYNNDTGQFNSAQSTITSISVTTPDGVHTYTGKGLVLDFDFSDSEIGFTGGTIQTEVIETAAAKITLSGQYAALDDTGTISTITIEDPSNAANKVSLSGASFSAVSVIEAFHQIDGDHLSEFFASTSNQLLNGDDTMTVNGTLAIHGFDGNDVLTGDAAANTLYGDANNDTLDGAAGNDILDGGDGNDNVKGGAGEDSLYGGDGNDILDGGTGADYMEGGEGDDTYYVDSFSDMIVENAYNGSSSPNPGTDTVHASISGYMLGDNLENLVLDGSVVAGSGNTLANTITGNAAANIIDGKGGADHMDGGAGNDTYYVDNVGDSIVDSAGTADTVVSTLSTYTLGAGIENLVLGGSDDLNGTGNELKNILTGNVGNNILDGGLGADTMSGGAGNDTYYVDNTGDKIVESAGNGTADSVFSSVNYTLSANVENLTLTGTATAGTGNDSDNVITGSVAGVNYTLDGKGGEDSLVGNTGNDTYYVDNANDHVIEASNAGTDLVVSTADYYYLADNVENLTLGGTGNIQGIGNTLANIITGNSGDNYLDGAGIASGTVQDTLSGGAGNDTYVVYTGNEVLIDSSGTKDTVLSHVSYTLQTGFERLTLEGTDDINGTGNAAANLIIGNTGDNTLDGGAGADTMMGGDGSDTYIVDNAGDKVYGGIGVDTVIASASYSAAVDAQGYGNGVDNITLVGTAVKYATGNDLDNSISGTEYTTALTLSGGGGADILSSGDGKDTLDGGTGVDTMYGGYGSDTYIVDDANDKVMEYNYGSDDTAVDLVKASVSYTLASEVENLTLTGTADLTGTGNAGDNVITGNSGDNYLRGGGAATFDTLMGGAGNDTYLYTGVEKITDSSGTHDVVIVNQDFDLSANVGNFTGIEEFDLQMGVSAALRLTGDAKANILVGNEFGNIMNGGAGADTMAGGDGDDLYTVDNVKDVIVENLDEGTDSVRAAVSYKLSDNIENLKLVGPAALVGTGNALNNILDASTNLDSSANTANHTLDGGVGADTMHGGTGNDTYYVDNALDIINDDGGTKELVVSTLASYTLAGDLENLTLGGTGNIDGTGNSGVNVITGNAGNNVLDGGGIADGLSGNDTLSGGAGNDTYMLHSGTEVLKETSGTDTINLTAYTGGSMSWTLATGFENLVLGGGVITGYGNAANNELTGTSGDDKLDGKAGADVMSGGDGNDLYYVDNAGDSIFDTSGTDTVRSTVSYVLGAGLEILTLDGTAAINGTGNDSNNTITGNSGNNTLDGGIGDDLLIGGKGNDFYIVDSTSDVITEFVGEGTDTVATSVMNLSLGDVAYNNIENATILGNTGLMLTGNTGTNVLTGGGGNDKLFGQDSNDILVGNAGDDTLDGGTGNDTMTGGAGNDAYYVDASGDKLVEAANGGTDTVYSIINYTLATNFENLVLQGSALVGTGNTADNQLTGNSGSNTLDGKTGADTMTGGDGDDTYYVDNTGDIIQETGGLTGGNDVEYSSITTSLQASVETLILTGTAAINATGRVSLDDTLIGNSGNNLLNGLGGADHLIGGKGNDTYYYSGTETIVENANEGTDTVAVTSLLTVDLTDTAHFANIENVTGLGGSDYVFTGTAGVNVLTGDTGDDTLYGGAGNDTLIGGAGHDTLDGGTGNDKMTGGDGDDVYYVDSTGDSIVETTTGGNDVVHSTLASYTLAANVEALYLDGAAKNGTGNALANYIEGNTGVNTINGGAGDDVIYGHGGADKLTGGTGNDTFVFMHGDVGNGVATITDFTHNATTAAHDVIDISDILSDAGYVSGVDNINDYVHLTQGTGNTVTLSVDATGSNGAGVNIVTFTLADHTATLDTLIGHGEIVV